MVLAGAPVLHLPSPWRPSFPRTQSLHLRLRLSARVVASGREHGRRPDRRKPGRSHPPSAGAEGDRPSLMDADGGRLVHEKGAGGGLHLQDQLEYRACEDAAPRSNRRNSCCSKRYRPARPALAFWTIRKTICPPISPMIRRSPPGSAPFKDPWIVAGADRPKPGGRSRAGDPPPDADAGCPGRISICSQIFAHQLGSYLTVEELARHVAESRAFRAHVQACDLRRP